MVELEIVLIVAALVGAGLNVARGAAKSTSAFSFRLFAGGLITASIAALAAVSLFDVTTLGGLTQVVLLGLLTGFSADVTLSKLKSR
jgi:hypothetical protein